MTEEFKKQDQHWVPQSYLRNFATKEDPNKIWSKNIFTDVPIGNKPNSIKKVAQEGNLWGSKDCPEEIHLSQNVEPQAKELLTEIIKTGTLPKIQSEEHKTLCYTIASQYKRTHILRIFKALPDFLLRTIGKNFNFTTQDYKWIKEKSSEESQQQWEDKFNEIYQLATGLQHLDMFLIRNLSKCHFITSDHPVIIQNPFTTWYSYGGFEYGLQIFYPISPFLMIVLYDTEIYKIHRKLINKTLNITNEETIQELNQLQYYYTHKNIYASYKNSFPAMPKSWRNCGLELSNDKKILRFNCQTSLYFKFFQQKKFRLSNKPLIKKELQSNTTMLKLIRDLGHYFNLILQKSGNLNKPFITDRKNELLRTARPIDENNPCLPVIKEHFQKRGEKLGKGIEVQVPLEISKKAEEYYQKQMEEAKQDKNPDTPF